MNVAIEVNGIKIADDIEPDTTLFELARYAGGSFEPVRRSTREAYGVNLVHRVFGLEKVGLAGGGCAAADVYAANGSFRRDDDGAAGSALLERGVADAEALDGTDAYGFIRKRHRGFLRLYVAMTRLMNNAQWF